MNYIDYQEKKRRKSQLKKTGVAVIFLVAAVVIAVALLSGKGKGTIDRESQTDETEPEYASTIPYDELDTVEAETEPDDGSIPTFFNPTTQSTAGTSSQSETSTSSAASQTTAKPTEGSTYAYAYAGFAPVLANTDIQDWRLLLVNRDYILPEGYSVNLSEAVKGTGVNLDSRVAPFYQKMYDAAKADGVTLTPLSGHRRVSTQKRNFENKISYYQNQGYSKAEATQLAAKIILPPGTSEHNAGIAMDICSLDVSFEKSNEFAWLQKNAADYGFILRYTREKIDITKITYEPWHWRYVGADTAKKIKAQGVCLEEYLGAVR